MPYEVTDTTLIKIREAIAFLNSRSLCCQRPIRDWLLPHLQQFQKSQVKKKTISFRNRSHMPSLPYWDFKQDPASRGDKELISRSFVITLYKIEPQNQATKFYMGLRSACAGKGAEGYIEPAAEVIFAPDNSCIIKFSALEAFKTDLNPETPYINETLGDVYPSVYHQPFQPIRKRSKEKKEKEFDKMAYFSGASLHELIKNSTLLKNKHSRSPITQEEWKVLKIKLAYEALVSLEQIHVQNRVIFGDIKAENIMIYTTQAGELLAQCIDIGFMCPEGSPFTDLRGAPIFMDIEKIKALALNNPGTQFNRFSNDIYSLGLVFIELFTGNTVVSNVEYQESTYRPLWNKFKFVRHEPSLSDEFQRFYKPVEIRQQQWIKIISSTYPAVADLIARMIFQDSSKSAAVTASTLRQYFAQLLPDQLQTSAADRRPPYPRLPDLEFRNLPLRPPLEQVRLLNKEDEDEDRKYGYYTPPHQCSCCAIL